MVLTGIYFIIFKVHPLQPGIHGISITLFLKLFDSDVNEQVDIIGMRFYICSLRSKKVFHFTTENKDFMNLINEALHGK